jgi:hypothetical protein
VKVNITKKFDLHIENSAFLYVGRKLANISPQEFWDARGLSGHKRDKDQANSLHERSFAAVQTPDGEPVLRSFLDDTIKVFDMMTHEDFSHISQFIGARKFVFVTGVMRSGGTYLLSELSKIHDAPHRKIDMAMIHDRIPKYEHLYYCHQPLHYMNTLLELAQFLVWMHREMHGMPVVVKKHQTLSFGLPLIDRYFGQNCTYITTLRHPLTTAVSMAQLDGIDLKSTAVPVFYSQWRDMLLPMSNGEYDRLPFYEKFLLYYEKLYTEFAKHNQSIRGKIIPVVFGKGYETFLKTYAQDYKTDYEAAVFNASPKTPVPEALEKANIVLERLQKTWAAAGLEFPDLEVI